MDGLILRTMYRKQQNDVAFALFYLLTDKNYIFAIYTLVSLIISFGEMFNAKILQPCIAYGTYVIFI